MRRTATCLSAGFLSKNQVGCFQRSMNDMDRLVSRLVAHLAADSGTTRRDVARRVEKVRNLLENLGLLPKLVECCKDECRSENMRFRGNESFKRRRLTEALEFYTKSVGFGGLLGTNLALAYANRSAVLCELKLYEECLKVSKKFRNQ